jgi:hypothetical protein
MVNLKFFLGLAQKKSCRIETAHMEQKTSKLGRDSRLVFCRRALFRRLCAILRCSKQFPVSSSAAFRLAKSQLLPMAMASARFGGVDFFEISRKVHSATYKARGDRVPRRA